MRSPEPVVLQQPLPQQLSTAGSVVPNTCKAVRPYRSRTASRNCSSSFGTVFIMFVLSVCRGERSGSPHTCHLIDGDFLKRTQNASSCKHLIVCRLSRSNNRHILVGSQ